MKTKARRILAVVMATATMATGVGNLTANAESLPVEETMEIILVEDDMIAPCSSTVTKTYDCSELENIGMFKASSSTVYLSFNEPEVGAVSIKFHTGGYDGDVYKTITPPEAGTTGTTLTTSFSVVSGTKYYITAEPIKGYLSTRGSFTITY